MTGLLDKVIENTQGNARILREQHDINQIDVGEVRTGGLPSEGLQRQIDNLAGDGFWDAAEYGISREEQIVKLRASLAKALEYEKSPEGIEAARKEVEATLNVMRARAIGRANLGFANGKIALVTAGGLPWHKLGVHVDQPMKSGQCIKLAGQDYKVIKVPLNYSHDGKIYATDRFALVREDTGARLDTRTVGNVYEPIQNSEGFEFLDTVLDEFGARYESAGALYGGKQVFICAHLPKQRFAVNGTDVQEPFVLFFNPHDGLGRAICCPTSVRTECANTTRIALRNAKRQIAWKHTGSTKGQIKEAQRMLGLAVEGYDQYKHQAEALVKTPVAIRAYANDVLDAVLEVTQAEAMKGADILAAMVAKDDANRELLRKSFEKKIERRGEILSDILERYESEKNGTKGMRGSAWAAYNAVTDHADHNTIGRQVGTNEVRASRRLESILVGAADEMKQVAFEKALELSA